MLVDLLALACCAALGVLVQRRRPDADRIRERLWQANFAILIPLAAAYAFLTIELDRDLLVALACGVTAWWLTVLVAGAYARVVAPSRPSRGALWLVGAIANTGFIGYPLALLAFGTEGLRLAIVYDQVSLVIPMVVVGTVIARRHADQPELADEVDRSLVHQAIVNPPMLTVLVLLALRATLVRDPLELAWLGELVGLVIGPVGFLLLGLSIPLGGFTHDRREVLSTTGVSLVRVLVGPAMVWLVVQATGASVPDALYLLAALPTAFASLVIARVHQLEVEVVRLGLLITTALSVGGTIAWVAVSGPAG